MFRRFLDRILFGARKPTLEADLLRERAENIRLRAENRALLNSILGIAGIPPLPPIATTFLTPPAPAGHSESAPPSRAADAPLSTPASSVPPTAVASEPPQRQSRTRNGSSLAPPHRRRSWHQINRILEIESARKASP